jgi:hypothetical protein
MMRWLVFQLNLVCIKRQVEDAGKPYLDWLECDVMISDPSFSGRFSWSVMPGELLSLADDLNDLYRRFPKLGSIAFEPAEPNVILGFSIKASGRIDGQYVVRGDVMGSVLQGEFTIDQSYLPEVVQRIRDFVKNSTA